MTRPTGRWPSQHYKLTLLADRPSATDPGEKLPGHRIHMTIGFDPATGTPREVFFTGRGKSGHGLDDLLLELGTKISRALQNRDPETGAAFP